MRLLPTAEQILRVVEPLIFGKRWLTLLVLLSITGWLAFQAAQIEPDAGFEKSIPLEHPYMKTLKKYESEIGGANSILVALIKKDGEMYTPEFVDRLLKVNDAVFFLPGVDKSKVTSLVTPNTRFVEVVEGGFAGGDVFPSDFRPTEEGLARLKSNVNKSGIVGRLVASDHNGALIQAPLLERDPGTDEPLDYRELAHKLEDIRDKFQTDEIRVHIIGFAKVVGDVTDATLEVIGFFLIALVMTTVLLWGYCGSIKLAMLPLGCSVIAVIWEFGLLRWFGFGLDPFAILVPFLVLSVSVSHGVQYVNAWVAEVADGKNSYDASLETFRQLAIPGTTALITDVAGFATIYLINIQIIQEMSLNAAFGVAAIIITNKMLMPVWLTYVKIHDLEAFQTSQRKRDAALDKIWTRIAVITRRGPAITTLSICLLLLGWALYMYPALQVGDAQKGVPELRPDSRYNKDSNAIVDNFAIGVDILKVVVEAEPQSCINYAHMEEIDRFVWRMRNTAGVQSVLSLSEVAKQVNRGYSEGQLNAQALPRNSYMLSQATAPVPTATGLLNSDCSLMTVWVFTEDHKAKTLAGIVDAVKGFDEENKDSPVTFALASGNVGVMAATNEVVKAQELPVVGYVYVVVVVFLFLSFGTLSGVLCVVLPLSLVSVMAYAVMAVLDIGLKVATLPVVALAVGIGVDYGIYIYSTLTEGMSRGMDLEAAFHRTLQKTGKAVVFTGIALGGSVATWLWSGLQFQADMGLLLVFMFTANMFGAILVLPALARFLVNPDKIKPGTAAH